MTDSPQTATPGACDSDSAGASTPLRIVAEWRNISKAWSGAPVIDGLSLRVHEAETVALIGPSGCGKSTLLRLLVGLEVPTEGEVHVLGSRVTPDTLSMHRQQIGYVIQEGGLFPHLSCTENLKLVGDQAGWNAERSLKRIRQLAELVQLPESLLLRDPGRLSGGQRQRVSLMRALMLDPPLLLLDEPLGALDPLVRADLQTDLKQIFQSLGKSVVMVTHDLPEAVWFADRIVLMNEGQIAQVGPAKTILTDQASEFVQQFVNAQRRLSGF